MDNRVKGAILVIFLASYIPYHWGNWNDFAFDDSAAIVSNTDAHFDRGTLKDIFLNDFWGTRADKIGSHKSYRPLVILSFWVQHGIHGLEAFYFHVANNLLHSLCSILVFLLSWELLESFWASFVAATIFAVHPVHVEAVTGLVGRAEELCGIFYILGYLAYRRHLRTEGTKASWMWFAVTAACFYAGVLSKETCATLAMACGLEAFLYAGIRRNSEVHEERPQEAAAYEGAVDEELKAYDTLAKTSSDESPVGVDPLQVFLRAMRSLQRWVDVEYLFNRAMNVLLLAVGYLLIRVSVAVPGGILGTFLAEFPDNISDTVTAYGFERPLYGTPAITTAWKLQTRMVENPFVLLTGLPKVLSLNYLQVYYFWLLLFPKDLCCEYAFNCIPAVESLSDPRVWGIIAFDVVFLALVVYCVRGIFTGNRSARRWTRALGWLVIPFITSCNLFITVGTLVAERLLYIPSIGYCMMVGLVLAAPAKAWDAYVKDRAERALLQRNRGEPAGRLNGSVTANGSRTHNHRGKPTPERGFNPVPVLVVLAVLSLPMAYRTYLRTFDWESTAVLFKRGHDVCPKSAKLTMFRGQEELQQGNLDEAERLLYRAMEIDETLCDVLEGLSFVSLQRGNFTEASRRLREGIKCGPIVDKMFLLNQAFWTAVRTKGADSWFSELIASTLVYRELFTSAGMYYIEAAMIRLLQGDIGGAFTDGMEALYHNSHLCPAYNLLGRAFSVAGDVTTAIQFYMEALRCTAGTEHGPLYDGGPLRANVSRIPSIDEVTNTSSFVPARESSRGHRDHPRTFWPKYNTYRHLDKQCGREMRSFDTSWSVTAISAFNGIQEALEAYSKARRDALEAEAANSTSDGTQPGAFSAPTGVGGIVFSREPEAQPTAAQGTPSGMPLTSSSSTASPTQSGSAVPRKARSPDEGLPDARAPTVVDSPSDVAELMSHVNASDAEVAERLVAMKDIDPRNGTQVQEYFTRSTTSTNGSAFAQSNNNTDPKTQLLDILARQGTEMYVVEALRLLAATAQRVAGIELELLQEEQKELDERLENANRPQDASDRQMQNHMRRMRELSKSLAGSFKDLNDSSNATSAEAGANGTATGETAATASSTVEAVVEAEGAVSVPGRIGEGEEEEEEEEEGGGPKLQWRNATESVRGRALAQLLSMNPAGQIQNLLLQSSQQAAMLGHVDHALSLLTYLQQLTGDQTPCQVHYLTGRYMIEKLRASTNIPMQQVQIAMAYLEKATQCDDAQVAEAATNDLNVVKESVEQQAAATEGSGEQAASTTVAAASATAVAT